MKRYFYLSYNGENPADGKTVIGHLAFDHPSGFPSMLYICEQLVPSKSRVPITNVVITYLYEFFTEDDFNDFITGYDFKDQLGIN